MASPPARVPKACSARMSIVSVRNPSFLPQNMRASPGKPPADRSLLLQLSVLLDAFRGDKLGQMTAVVHEWTIATERTLGDCQRYAARRLMPSKSFQAWRNERSVALDELEAAHQSVGGTGRGRRYATQQINQAYTVLLCSQFQGFCRDLQVECADYFVQGHARLFIGCERNRAVVRNETCKQRQKPVHFA